MQNKFCNQNRAEANELFLEMRLMKRFAAQIY